MSVILVFKNIVIVRICVLFFLKVISYMKKIREARVSDVEKIRDMFVQAYGNDYPFTGFYDTEWLKKAVYDDGTLFLVMEINDEVIATASMMLTSGGLDDMIGEIGRLVATPDMHFRGKGLFNELLETLVKRTSDRVQFLMAEARTPHPGSQRILEEMGWKVAGFEPLKYLVGIRESMVMYASTQGMAMELRRNNPRVIAEASVLAQTVLKNMDFPVDVIVENEVNGYPTEKDFNIEHLKDQQGISSLLRIERGRVSNREIFGNFSLSHGFFRISDPRSNYLIARDGDAVLGAVGFSHDFIDRKVRIFELIEFDDAVKGALLAAVDRIAREELEVDYQEVDVSAYSPKIQRTFERLGFVPAAYCPSMVFEKVERLDVIRMAKLCRKYTPGPMRLLEAGKQMQKIVEKGFEDRLIGMGISEAVQRTDLFNNLPDGDLYHLSRISRFREYKSGTFLMKQGDEAGSLFILVSGEAEVIVDGKPAGTLREGRIIGEMALVDKGPRSADILLKKDCSVVEIEFQRLEHLMETYPQIGYSVGMNLAKSLSSKLRDSSAQNRTGRT